MTAPNLKPDALSEQERTFLGSLNAPASPDAPRNEEEAALMGTWLAMAAFADTAEIKAMRHEALLAAGVVRPVKRPVSRYVGIGLAACLTLAIGGGGFFAWSGRMQAFTAPAQGIAHVTLKDGTEITLSAGGQIRSRIGASKREIDLVRGDAYFAVTHDEKRPLTVTTSSHRAVDLGTEFNITQTGDAYRLTLVSGAVRIENLKTGYASDLKPGQSYIDQAGHERISDDAPARVSSWARGHLAFEDASLSDVGVAFQRLTGRRLIFTTPAVARLHLSGTVNLDNVDRASQALSAALPVTATPTAQGDILVSPR
ncbi:hypothetical protein MMA231_03888 (plasmid) [Asticcacaulis sp. MM231]|uniref:FecR family protein n=1 Tax=Asticcacaulis sp. MM231 TaxID=3157666 RepID=UPI0032D5B06F